MMHTYIARLRAISFWVLLFAALPAAAALFGDDTARQGVAEQAKRVDALKLESDAMTKRLAAVEEALKNQPVLELASQLQLLRQELKALQGQVEVLGNNIEGAAKRQRDMYLDLDARLKRLEQAPAAAPAAAAAAPGAAPAAPGTPTAAPSTASADETRVYEAAQTERRNGNYQGAITAFQSFITQFPKSSLAHRAQYWIGDSYFNMRDFKSAIASQQRLLANYADSASVPDALLNIASSQAEMGDTAAARKTMDGLVAKYPSSEAADKARRRLATLK